MNKFTLFFYLITSAVLGYYEEELKWYEASSFKKLLFTFAFPFLYLFALIVGLFCLIADYYDYKRDKE